MKDRRPLDADESPAALLAGGRASGSGETVTARRTDWDLVAARAEHRRGPLHVASSTLEIRLRLEKQLPGPSRFIVFSGLRGDVSVELTALEVAKAFASGRRDPVLLLETDASKGGSAKDFECGRDPDLGLFDWMRGQSSLDDVVRTLVPGSLFRLPAGSAESDPAGWLASASGSEALAELGMQFFTVICSAAPMGTASGRVMAARADYLALVLERGRHGQSEVRAAADDARRVSECGVGVVLAHERPASVSETTMRRRASKVASRIVRRLW